MDQSMRRLLLPGVVALFLQACGAPAMVAQVSELKPRKAFTVWDTGKASAADFLNIALSGGDEWTMIAPDKKHESFKGDAVLSNGQIAAVLHKQDSAVVVHGRGSA